MTEIEPQNERMGKKDKDRIQELERVVKALVTGLFNIEDDTGDAYMPEGTYYGTKFEG